MWCKEKWVKKMTVWVLIQKKKKYIYNKTGFIQSTRVLPGILYLLYVLFLHCFSEGKENFIEGSNCEAETWGKSLWGRTEIGQSQALGTRPIKIPGSPTQHAAALNLSLATHSNTFSFTKESQLPQVNASGETIQADKLCRCCQFPMNLAPNPLFSFPKRSHSVV